MIRRREFLSNSALSAAALLLAKPARLARAAASSPSDSRVEVLLDETSGHDLAKYLRTFY